MSSNQMPVSDEMLAESLAYASAESKFKAELLTNDIFVSEDKITSVWTDSKGYYDIGLNRYQEALVETKAESFQKARTEANNVLSNVFKWIKDTFRKASEKLKVLAEKILDLVKTFGIGAMDILARMRKFIFRWVLTNSALPSVVISDDKTSVNLNLSNMTTSGSLEFGRVDSDLNVVENIIGILKIIPSISIKVDASYDSKITGSTK